MKQVSKYVSAGESKEDGKKKKERTIWRIEKVVFYVRSSGEGDNPYLEGME